MLDEHGVRQSWEDLPKANTTAELSPARFTSKRYDAVISCGGDGTLLQVARRVAHTGLPILGVNFGSLGFLTAIRDDGIERDLPRILKGAYEIHPRMAVQYHVKRQRKTVEKGWALNDVVVTRGSHSHMVRLSLHVAGEYVTDYHCDGLILATPTGSTAYSLSAGGPIISPMTHAFAITPICAHALTNRPLVVNSSRNLKLTVPEKSAPVALQVDGLSCQKLLPGDTLEISQAKKSAMLMGLKETGFFGVVREKLRWSGTNI